jgi:diguanylate cyclase (GGDEF)-like protein/PAS domain S-box-containing protein
VGSHLRASRIALKQWDGAERLPVGAPKTKKVPVNALVPGSEHLRFLHAAFGAMHDLVAVCDPYGRVTLINQAMAVFSGLEPGATLPESWADFGEILTLDGERVVDGGGPMSRALRGETVRDVEMIMIGASGERRRMIVDGEPFYDADGELVGAIVVWHDVTERRLAEDQLAFHTHHNPLTGLPNRDFFTLLIRDALARAPSVRGWTAVLAINVDHFADIATRLGDREGDHSGDSFVAEVARRLDASLRRRDGSRPMDTLAHMGGDHFLVLCEDVADASAAKMIARRIAGALVAPMSLAGEELSVTACIGITLTRDPGRDAEPLMREAEAAMQRAQRRGAGRHEMFTGEMHAQRLVRIANESSLREALVRGEFYVEYQPKISLVTDRTVGVEALIRWMHPDRGLIAPLDFIPLAEESGIIVQIGAWVLEQVCRDAMRWRTALPGGHPLMVAVNVSPRQFESDLAETFGGIIGRSGIDPATVCLEVTESMVMHDAELAIATLRELKSLGLSISVDDFGTGFSSLAYLKRFPLDELKID